MPLYIFVCILCGLNNFICLNCYFHYCYKNIATVKISFVLFRQLDLAMCMVNFFFLISKESEFLSCSYVLSVFQIKNKNGLLKTNLKSFTVFTGETVKLN